MHYMAVCPTVLNKRGLLESIHVSENGTRMTKSKEKRIHRNNTRQHKESVIAGAQKSMDRNDRPKFCVIGNSAPRKTAPGPAMCSDQELADRQKMWRILPQSPPHLTRQSFLPHTLPAAGSTPNDRFIPTIK